MLTWYVKVLKFEFRIRIWERILGRECFERAIFEIVAWKGYDRRYGFESVWGVLGSFGDASLRWGWMWGQTERLYELRGPFRRIG